MCVISPPVRHTPSSYKAISGPPQGLLTGGGCGGGGGGDDITQLSSFLFVYLHPFHSFSFYSSSSLHGLTFPEPSDAAVFIKGICCKIRTPAKRVRDYLVLPSPQPPLPTSTHARFELKPSNCRMKPLAKFSLMQKYMIDIPQLSFHFERLDLMGIYFHSALTMGGGVRKEEK